MNIIENIEQGSSEWLDLRLGKVTASNFNQVITPKTEKGRGSMELAKVLAAEILMGQPEEMVVNNFWINRGNELEPDAIDAYQELSLNYVKQVSFIDCGNYGYSPDGLVDNEGLIEVKCPSSKKYIEHLHNREFPLEYKAQCQGGLFCSEREWLDFISYHPDFKDGKHIFVKRIYREERYIEELKKGINETIELRDEILNQIEK
jgi:hypothetical protein